MGIYVLKFFVERGWYEEDFVGSCGVCDFDCFDLVSGVGLRFDIDGE